MKIAVEFYVIVLLVVFMSVLGGNLINMNIIANNVRDYQTNCIRQIESSGHSQEVIDRLVSNSPYEISIEKLITGANQELVKIQIDYDYSIPILKVEQHYRISGVAR